MCKGENCPLKKNCYRYRATPNDKQSWMAAPYNPDTKNCPQLERTGGAMTNKSQWLKLGNVDYIHIETRPPRKSEDKTRCEMSLDWIPNADSGACEAFQALLEASLNQHTPDEAKAFYAALKAFAESFSPKPQTSKPHVPLAPWQK